MGGGVGLGRSHEAPREPSGGHRLGGGWRCPLRTTTRITMASSKDTKSLSGCWKAERRDPRVPTIKYLDSSARSVYLPGSDTGSGLRVMTCSGLLVDSLIATGGAAMIARLWSANYADYADNESAVPFKVYQSAVPADFTPGSKSRKATGENRWTQRKAGRSDKRWMKNRRRAGDSFLAVPIVSYRRKLSKLIPAGALDRDLRFEEAQKMFLRGARGCFSCSRLTPGPTIAVLTHLGKRRKTGRLGDQELLQDYGRAKLQAWSSQLRYVFAIRWIDDGDFLNPSRCYERRHAEDEICGLTSFCKGKITSWRGAYLLQPSRRLLEESVSRAPLSKDPLPLRHSFLSGSLRLPTVFFSPVPVDGSRCSIHIPRISIFSLNMRMKLLKVVVILLLAGSGEARPQKADLEDSTKAGTTATSNEGWKPTRASNEQRDSVREDSRYTRNSGSNRMPYIPYFHGERGTKLDSPSRAFSLGARKRSASETRPFLPLDGSRPLVSLSPRATARRAANFRRSKIDKQWTESGQGFALVEDVISRKSAGGFADLLVMKGEKSNVAEESGSGTVFNRLRESSISNTSSILENSAATMMISGRGSGKIVDDSSGDSAFIENSPKRIGEYYLDASSGIIENSRPKVSLNDHPTIPMSNNPMVSESFDDAAANRRSEILVQNSKSRNGFREVSPSRIETSPALNVSPRERNSTDAFGRYPEISIPNDPLERETASSRRSEILLKNSESLNKLPGVFPSGEETSKVSNVFPDIENPADTLDRHSNIPRSINSMILEGRTVLQGDSVSLHQNSEPQSTFVRVFGPEIMESVAPVVFPEIVKNADNVRAKVSRGASSKNVLNNSGRISRDTGLALNQKSQPDIAIVHDVPSTMQLGKDSGNTKHETLPFSSSSFASIVKRVSNITKDFNAQAMKSQELESTVFKSFHSLDKSPQNDLVVNRNIRHGNLARFPQSSIVHTSKTQKDKSGDKNETHLGQQSATVQNVYFKNWPNEALQDLEDLYNYEKYTSFKDQDNQNSQEPPVLPPKGVFHRRPTADSSVQEIIHWLKIPAFTVNETRVVEKEKIDDLSSLLPPVYHDLEPNRPLVSSDALNFVQNGTSQNGLDGHQIDDWPIYQPENKPTSSEPSNDHSNQPVATNQNIYFKDNKTSYNPTTQVTQDTVVHILNIGAHKANATTTGILNSEVGEDVKNKTPSPSSSSSSQVPNLHVAFTSQEVEGKDPMVQKPSPPAYDQNCPTILINSYTRINNTIQGKEGCTDLNIIINSHLLNTNIYKPLSIDKPSQSQDLTVEGSDKYGNTVQDYSQASPVYQSISSQVAQDDYQSPPSNAYDPSAIPQNDYQAPQKGPENSVQDTALSSSFEVFQGTQISLTSSSFPNEEQSSSLGSGSSVQDDPVGSSIGEGNEVAPALDSESSSGADEALVGASNIQNPVASNPISPVQVAGGPSSQAELGVVMGQANDAVASAPLQLPGLSNLPSLPGLPNLPGLANRPGLPNRPGASSSPGHSPGNTGGSSGLVSSSHDEEDEEEDELDLSPGGLMQSIGSIFAYLAFLNPLNYGFLSLAAAPFAAIAAGLLSMAAFFIPWAVPTVFDFGRAADKVTIRFRPTLEEIVRRSVHNSRNSSERRHLEDLEYIDQSLRSVATQLLNATKPEAQMKVVLASTTLASIDPDDSTRPRESSKREEGMLLKEINSEVTNLESMGVSFGRPMNSKFSYFESSHPGQAMAMTEEELEKELSSTRLMTAHKNRPTTTGGISTWILLNPPTTTMKPVEKNVETEIRVDVQPNVSTERTETTSRIVKNKVTLTPVATITTEKTSSGTKRPITVTTRKSTSVPKVERTTESIEKSRVTTPKVPGAADNTKESTSGSTTKKSQTTRTTPKPKGSTSKTTVASKAPLTVTKRPSQQARPKPSSTRRTTLKPEIIRNENASTAKIEKVTFKPVQMIVTPKIKVESTEKPMFVTKIKASVLMDTQKTTTMSSTSMSTANPVSSSKLSFSGMNLTEVPVRSKPIGTKVNNVLKVHLKKPLEEATKIEIEPIRVNAPVLKIEKIESGASKQDSTKDQEMGSIDNSRIDLKFDFNPELTKIKVGASVAEDTSTTTSTTTTSTTTKRPRHNSKRKKNKVRRRKPQTTSLAPTILSSTASTILLDSSEVPSTTSIIDNAIQESKIEPETKSTTNVTKTKKKPVQKPISTQIYNFLSREVMPSFGVMSLVGLGLGLASYFLYPFGGSITRRNYEVEPKYKYNLEEYGGGYGQNEEEVLSKVLQGMTNHESRYPGTKDIDNGYYHYQRFDTPYETTRKPDQRYHSSSPVYRPTESPATVLKYRNTEYRYPESTASYYDRSNSEFVVAQDVPGSANRQFVVGSVPKEYPPFEERTSPTKLAYEQTTQSFQRDVAQKFGSVNVQSYGRPEAQTLRADDGYEEYEITPTAVPVEHGPRSLKRKRSFVDGVSIFLRSKRDSVNEQGSSRSDEDPESSRFPKENRSFLEKAARILRSKRSAVHASDPLVEDSRTEALDTMKGKRGSFLRRVTRMIRSKRALARDYAKGKASVYLLNKKQSSDEARNSFAEEDSKFEALRVVEGKSRSRRDSVIQVIPSKHELEEQEKEEDLSNEIFDIIDSALPGGDEETKSKFKNEKKQGLENEVRLEEEKHHRQEDNEVEDLQGQKRKQQEEERTRLKESTMRTTDIKFKLENAEDEESDSSLEVQSIEKDVSSASMDASSSSTSFTSVSSQEESTTIPSRVTTEPVSKVSAETTVDWFETSTTKKPEESFNLFKFVKKVAEIKFRLGLTLLKHASEGFARYLGHVQKRINGEE
ncbi:hypothetical protein KM043_014035 [Ampulex compressa]|nr:hypothetical protein KM043_014035 [Ampulex compressa]